MRRHTVGAIGELPLQDDMRVRRRGMGLGLLVGRFKMRSAKRVNVQRGAQGMPIWQRNCYEHLIHSEQDRQHYRAYIALNPGRWDKDREHPVRSR